MLLVSDHWKKQDWKCPEMGQTQACHLARQNCLVVVRLLLEKSPLTLHRKYVGKQPPVKSIPSRIERKTA